MQIRKTNVKDIDELMVIFEEARAFMREQGNPNQWKNNRPERSAIEKDVEEGKSYVCEQDGKIVGTFFFSTEPDPTYSYVKDGEWIKDCSYGVIHRIATKRNTKGVGTYCINWCFDRCESLRMDTHEDNKVMQNLLYKLGFKKCGIIFLESGDERLAFQKI